MRAPIVNASGLPLLIAGVTALLSAPACAQSPVPDGEIREVFVGKAACPPKPWPVGFGPYEFRADGVFFRQQDLASLSGRYAISGGRICVTFSGPAPPDFCLDVLKDKTQYFFRHNGAPVPDAPPAPFPVTPCPLPDER